MAELKEGAIAVLDVLGIKGIWSRTETEKIIGKWEETVQGFKALHSAIETHGDPKIIPTVQAFSDTIIITYEGKINDNKIIEYLGGYLILSFVSSLLNGIFLRGAISVGKYYSSPSLMIGPAVDEAVEWHQHADWLGVILTPSATFTVEKEITLGKFPKYFKKHQIAYKDGINRESWAMDWPGHIKAALEALHDTRLPKTAILETFSKYAIDIKNLPKYEHTIAFFEKFYNPNAKLRSSS